jgi:membrane fusion protein, multidrug efflux system
MMRSITTAAITAAVLVIVAGAYWFLFLPPTPTAAPSGAAGQFSIVVEASAAYRGTAVRKLKAVGTLASNNTIIVRPEIEGRVSAIRFEDGQAVAAKAPLFELDATLLNASADEARANLQLAQREYERIRELAARGNAPIQTRDQAEAELRASEARMRLAVARLDKAVVRAPFDGVVGMRKVSIGDYVSPGMDVVNLEQMRPIKVEFGFPERFLTALAVGQPILLRSDAYPGEEFSATISALDPRIDRLSRSVNVQGIAPNADGRLRPGQFVSVTVRVDEHRGSVFVPEQALISLGEDYFVFRIVEGRAQRVAVKPGLRIANHVAILSGLEVGDMVISAGHQKLGEGAPVTAIPATYVPPSPPDEEIETQRR